MNNPRVYVLLAVGVVAIAACAPHWLPPLLCVALTAVAVILVRVWGRIPWPKLPRWHAKPRGETRPAVQQSGVLRGARLLALAAIAALVAAASVASFMESFRALYEWAHEHGLSVRWSAVWPLQIDVFIAVGELALFVALIDGWQRRSRALPWVVTLLGLAVSVAGNVGHVGWQAPVADKFTAAVPPLAAAAALAVGLGVLKRVVEHRQGAVYGTTSVQVPAPAFTNAETAAAEALARSIAGGNAFSPNALASKFRLTRAESAKVVAAVTAAGNGHHPE
jgi:hypothetical protein